MTPAQGVEDVVPGIVNPGGPPLPPADALAGGHPRKKRNGIARSTRRMFFLRLAIVHVYIIPFSVSFEQDYSVEDFYIRLSIPNRLPSYVHIFPRLLILVSKIRPIFLHFFEEILHLKSVNTY